MYESTAFLFSEKRDFSQRFGYSASGSCGEIYYWGIFWTWTNEGLLYLDYCTSSSERNSPTPPSTLRIKQAPNRYLPMILFQVQAQIALPGSIRWAQSWIESNSALSITCWAVDIQNESSSWSHDIRYSLESKTKKRKVLYNPRPRNTTARFDSTFENMFGNKRLETNVTSSSNLLGYV